VRVLYHLLCPLCLAALAIPAFPATPVPSWQLARSEHFEVYAQSSGQRASAILERFEQLRAFFLQQSEWKTAGPLPVRVIVFASPDEYQPYRLRTNADAYYVGSGNRDYIVMAGADAANVGVAAHEYVHLILRASSLQFPPWLKEGLAELYTTLKMDDRSAELGASLPGRLQTLRRRDWMPLTDLRAISDASLQRQERATTDLFYAESWALTDMLALSPGYAADFQQLIAAPSQSLTQIYGKSSDAIERDLRAWVAKGPAAIPLPQVHPESVAVEVSEVPPVASRVLLAQLLLTAGEFDRAETLFSGLAQEAPDSADVAAALGTIALHKGDLNAARIAWKRAIDLRPDFDDAHYQLALIEKNAGRYEAALSEFQAMSVLPKTRAYAYWLALADTFNELGRRDEAESAAGHAAEHATTSAERSRAAQQTYFAQTDLSVQFARDASGQLQMVTTRTPHQQADWNPFIEPSDDIRRVHGTLREIDCNGVTTVRVEAAGKLLALSIPDLQHVQMRHAPQEFTCGPQDPVANVIVDYAAGGGRQDVVRGMDFQ
jgi:tetratricopeptide (TPR) repeat protein